MEQINHPYEAQIGGFNFSIPAEVMLDARVCDLHVKIEDTGYLKYARKLQTELNLVGLTKIQPQYYLGDEWFCPENTTLIAIPFWLANSQLKDLEKKFMGRIEGSTPAEFMRLLRHECGHCVEHSYELSRRRDWQEMFGSPSIPYFPDKYTWIKSSRDFVKHLPDGYAQSHPEEDFAETFAVWLDPKSCWRERYSSWDGAIAKLKFVDRLMKLKAKEQPKALPVNKISNASRIKKTLHKFYLSRQSEIEKCQSFDN